MDVEFVIHCHLQCRNYSEKLAEMPLDKIFHADFNPLSGVGKLPAPGRTTIWVIVGQGPIALAVCAGGRLFGHFSLLYPFFLFLPLSGRRPDID